MRPEPPLPAIPHNAMAEKRVLGLLLLGEPHPALRAELFHFEGHRAILRALETIEARGEEVTARSVVLELEKGHTPGSVRADYLVGLMDVGCGKGGLAVELEALERAYRGRALSAVLRSAGSAPAGEDPRETMERARADLTLHLTNGSAPPGPGWLAAHVHDVLALRAMERPMPQALFTMSGGGIGLPVGELGLIHGGAGRGKSWLALELAVAIASGQSPPPASPLHGMVMGDPVTVAVIALELDVPFLLERIETIALARRYSGFEERLHCLALADLPRPLDLASGDVTAIAQVIQATRAQLVIVDTLARANSGKEDQETLRPILVGLEHLGHQSRCGIIIVAHDRKGSGDPKASPEGIESARGAGDLGGFSKWALQVVPAPGNVLKALTSKANLGAIGVPVHFTCDREQKGLPTQCDAPADAATGKGNRTRKMILDAVRVIMAGTVEDVRRECGDDQASRDTTIRHLDALVSEGKIEQKDRRKIEGKWSKIYSIVYDDTRDTRDTQNENACQQVVDNEEDLPF